MKLNPRLLALPVIALAAAAGWSIVRAADNAPAPAVGSLAPTYALPDQDGVVHTSAQDKGKVVLLAFYPADFTGGCTVEAHSLTTAYPQLKQMGVTVYGVSVQDPKSHKAFCTKEGIPYTLLADTTRAAAKAFGVYLPGPSIASRVTYILGKDGHVVYTDASVNSHIATCGADWTTWLKAHPDVLGEKPAVAAVGKPAPAFALPNVATGQQTSLSALGQGKKATVVLFVATRCPYSNGYNARMATLAKKYAAQGIAFVGINSNATEPIAECAAHAKAHLPFPVLKDADASVADTYAAKVTPEAYVIDAHGTLVYHGRIDSALDPRDVTTHDLAAALDAVLTGHAVSATQPAAFGCSIKRG